MIYVDLSSEIWVEMDGKNGTANLWIGREIPISSEPDSGQARRRENMRWSRGQGKLETRLASVDFRWFSCLQKWLL